MREAAGPCFDFPFDAHFTYQENLTRIRPDLVGRDSLRPRGALQTALQLKLDFDRVVDPEEEVARILEAPINEWHIELRSARPVISGEFRLDRDGQFMFAAM